MLHTKYFLTIDDYRYGFNGKEMDNEVNSVTGATQDHKYRSYDSRLGRYKSIDPLSKSFPWNSPFAYAENRVIDGLDLEGREYIYYTIPYFDNHGNAALKKTGEVDYKNWLLNVTEGFGGAWSAPIFVVQSPMDGKNYFFSKKEIHKVNIEDFTDNRWTEEAVDAVYMMTDAAGMIVGGLQAQKMAPKGKGMNNPKVKSAAQRGNKYHYDELNGGPKGSKGGPSKVQEMYPETEFSFPRRGQKGADVEVIGGKHPSSYPGSKWQKGNRYGDFKPDTKSGKATFKSDIKKGKLPKNTQQLLY
jgi:RHS repeat-associated protein